MEDLTPTHSVNMKVRLGDQRKGLFGTKVLDKFNDGVRMDRFLGTGWFYKQEKLNLEKSRSGTGPIPTPRAPRTWSPSPRSSASVTRRGSSATSVMPMPHTDQLQTHHNPRLTASF